VWEFGSFGARFVIAFVTTFSGADAGLLRASQHAGRRAPGSNQRENMAVRRSCLDQRFHRSDNPRGGILFEIIVRPLQGAATACSALCRIVYLRRRSLALDVRSARAREFIGRNS